MIQAECFPSGVLSSPETINNYFYISNIQICYLPTSCALKPFLSCMQFGFVEVRRGWCLFVDFFFSFFFLGQRKQDHNYTLEIRLHATESPFLTPSCMFLSLAMYTGLQQLSCVFIMAGRYWIPGLTDLP